MDRLGHRPQERAGFRASQEGERWHRHRRHGRTHRAVEDAPRVSGTHLRRRRRHPADTEDIRLDERREPDAGVLPRRHRGAARPLPHSAERAGGNAAAAVAGTGNRRRSDRRLHDGTRDRQRPRRPDDRRVRRPRLGPQRDELPPALGGKSGRCDASRCRGASAEREPCDGCAREHRGEPHRARIPVRRAELHGVQRRNLRRSGTRTGGAGTTCGGTRSHGGRRRGTSGRPARNARDGGGSTVFPRRPADAIRAVFLRQHPR